MLSVIFKMSHLLVLSKTILYIYKKKSIFGIHDPTGVGYLFQLRVGLCSLSYHKKHHNFVDTPSNECQCNFVIEDANHFLFFCLFYETQRATLVTCVNGILQKYNLDDLGNQSNLYLYGHRDTFRLKLFPFYPPPPLPPPT